MTSPDDLKLAEEFIRTRCMPSLWQNSRDRKFAIEMFAHGLEAGRKGRELTEFPEKEVEQAGFEICARSEGSDRYKSAAWDGFAIGAKWMFRRLTGDAK